MAKWALIGAATVAVGAGLYAGVSLLMAPTGSFGSTPERPAEPEPVDHAREQPRDPVGMLPRSAAPRAAVAGDEVPTPPRPGPKLGSSMDPDRAETARAVYDAAVEELDRVPLTDVERAQRVYLRGSAALELMEDELEDDDELGHLELRRQTDTLRDSLLRFAPH